MDASQQQIADEQFQRTKADVRNILPYDLYEGMKAASRLKSHMIHSGELPVERRIKEFYDSFWSIFQFTALKINPQLAHYINGWFEQVKIPIDNTDDLTVGIELYIEFYNELVKMGIGSMFENPIEPPLGGSQEDEIMWAMENLGKLEQQVNQLKEKDEEIKECKNMGMKR